MSANQLLSEYSISFQRYMPKERRPMLGYQPYTANSEFEHTLVLADVRGRIAFMKHKTCGNWVAEVHMCHHCHTKEKCCGQQ